LRLTTTIKMAKDCKEGLGLVSSYRGPLFSLLTHTTR
jgi:hypothetical protein